MPKSISFWETRISPAPGTSQEKMNKTQKKSKMDFIIIRFVNGKKSQDFELHSQDTAAKQTVSPGSLPESWAPGRDKVRVMPNQLFADARLAYSSLANTGYLSCFCEAFLVKM